MYFLQHQYDEGTFHELEICAALQHKDREVVRDEI